MAASMQSVQPLSSLRACPDCGMICQLPAQRPGFDMRCVRCAKILRHATHHPLTWTLACAITGFLFYFIVLTAPFIQVLVYGRFRSSTMTTGVTALGHEGLWMLASIVLFTAIFLPLLKLLNLLCVSSALHLRHPPRWIVPLFRHFRFLNTWAMVEIYLLGFLVAYTRLRALAHVEVETAVFALIGLVLSMVSIDAALEPEAVWEDMQSRHLVPVMKQPAQGLLIGCDICHQANEKNAVFCARCGGAFHPRKPNSLARTWALTIAALILYIPANIFPVMHITKLEKITSYTILRGVQDFWEAGLWPLALLVFTASIAIPVFKLMALGWMLIQTRGRSSTFLPARARLYRFIDFVGRWSMIDIFMLSILVGLMHFGLLAQITAGPGAIYFASVIILTMAAVASFDPRLMWDAAKNKKIAQNDQDRALRP